MSPGVSAASASTRDGPSVTRTAPAGTSHARGGSGASTPPAPHIGTGSHVSAAQPYVGSFVGTHASPQRFIPVGQCASLIPMKQPETSAADARIAAIFLVAPAL